MKIIVTVVDITSEAHIVDRYNTGEMVTDMNIFQVDFESLNARIVQKQSDAKSASIEEVRL